jgi:hypothetical protein
MERQIGIVALVTCLTVGSGFAADAPRASHNVVRPAATAAADVLRNVVIIRNVGDQALSLSQWDGGSWRTVTVEVGATLHVQCPRCGATIPIVFRIGRNLRVPARRGMIYTASRSSGEWRLAVTRGL